MIKWVKIEAGEYQSEDERFTIYKIWDRLYGNHWELRDMNEPDRYKGTYYEKTLLDCKLLAERITNRF